MAGADIRQPAGSRQPTRRPPTCVQGLVEDLDQGFKPFLDKFSGDLLGAFTAERTGGANWLYKLTAVNWQCNLLCSLLCIIERFVWRASGSALFVYLNSRRVDQSSLVHAFPELPGSRSLSPCEHSATMYGNASIPNDHNSKITIGDFQPL